MLSPLNPSKTIRIFSSAEYFLRVLLRMFLTVVSADVFFSAIRRSFCVLTMFGRKVSHNFSPYFVPHVLKRYSDIEDTPLKLTFSGT